MDNNNPNQVRPNTPPPVNPGAYNAPKPQGNGNIGFGIASMVLGILSILTCCGYGLIFAIVGVILGGVAMSKNYAGRGMAIAGIVTSIIGLVLNGFLVISCLISGTSASYYSSMF